MSREIQIEIALDLLDGEVKAKIVWLPFQLNPGIPDEGMTRPEYCKAKLGSDIAVASGVSGWPGQANPTSVAEKEERALNSGSGR